MRSGFSRANLLAAVLVLGLGGGVAAPALYRASAQQDRKTSVDNLKQLGLANANFHDLYNHFPPIAGTVGGGKEGSLHFHLLPFLEQQNVWQTADLTAAIEVLRHPGDRSAPAGGVYKKAFGTTNYAGNWLVFKGGPNGPGATTMLQIVNGNGTSMTMMFAERFQVCNGTPCLWGYDQFYYSAPMFAYFSQGKFQVRPPQETCNPALPQSIAREGILIGMCDGSVRLIGNEVGADVWGFALHPANARDFRLPDN
jgi:hypothetical protein